MPFIGRGGSSPPSDTNRLHGYLLEPDVQPWGAPLVTTSRWSLKQADLLHELLDQDSALVLGGLSQIRLA
ncbi:MAG: hypothetical protein QOC80_1665 [Frankiaceae bacterium]|nr:hypothetical protein [Frankiaceae bacterium]